MGCSSYKRNVLAASQMFSKVTSKCPVLDTAFVSNAPSCGNACPMDPDISAGECFETKYIHKCSPAATKCVVGRTVGCSGREMERTHHAWITKAVDAGCADNSLEFLQTGLSQPIPRVNSLYAETKVAMNCIKNVSNFDPVVSLSECLMKASSSTPQTSLVGTRFTRTISGLASAILKMRADGPTCEIPSLINMLGAHFATAYTPKGPRETCSQNFYQMVTNCTAETKRVIFEPFITDCSVDYAKLCGLPAINNCFFEFIMSSERNGDKLGSCLNTTLTQCESHPKSSIFQIAHDVVEFARGLDWTDVGDQNGTVVELPYTKENVEKYYGDNECVCDPALAVHCIFDVHHLSKQDDPDWEGLCPMVSKSSMCAQRFVQGCQECQKETVIEIVSKLNYGLRKTCENPPETECRSIKAMDCITDLMRYQKENPEADNLTTCVEISKTRQCIEENLYGCTKTTEMKVNLLLDEVIANWEDLVCGDSLTRLDSCRKIFEESVKQILSFDVNAMFNDLAINTTQEYEELQKSCEEMETSWGCVSNTLDQFKDSPGSRIIKDSLEGIYISMKKRCTRSPATLECHSCFGQGSSSCSSGTTIEQCSPNSVCQTVNNNGMVMSRGCTPSTSCRPGCKDDVCTYCCSKSRCNDLDDGPIAGSCDREAMSDCIFEMAEAYTNGESFSCRMVDDSLQCLEHERMKCEMGGVSFSLDDISASSLRDAAENCLLKEADQTCSILPIITTASFVARGGSFESNYLCKLVADNRNAIKVATASCTDDEVEDIKRNAMAFEEFLGYLDCSSPYEFILGDNCNTLEAMKCLKTLNFIKQRTCYNVTETANCAKKHLKECRPTLFAVPIRQKFGLLLRNIENGTCDGKLTEGDERDDSTIVIESCFDRFIQALDGDVTPYTIMMAVNQLQQCLFGLDPDIILDLSSVKKLSLESLVDAIEVFLENKDNNMSNVSTEGGICHSAMKALVRQNFVDAFVLPLSDISIVPSICESLNDHVEMVIHDVCAVELQSDSDALANEMDLIDMIRENLIVGYCPKATPIPRCLLSRAYQCLDRFSAYVASGQESNNLICREARSLIDCSEAYVSVCALSEDVNEFRMKSLFALETITQVCNEESELVAKARCTLLRQINVRAGCNTTALSDCKDLPAPTNCTWEDEGTAACFFENAGGCIDTVQQTLPSTHQVFTDYLNTCRMSTWPDGSAKSNIYAPCSQPPKMCDVSAAAGCLSTMASALRSGSTNITFVAALARDCLEKNFYCYSSVISLLSTNTREYSELLVHALEFTPAWTEMESGSLIQLLNLPSNVIKALQKTPPVDLNLWNICWDMDNALMLLQAVKEKFPNMELPSFKESAETLKFTILTVCNGFGDVAEMLQFPAQENPTCAESSIRANIDLLMTRSITEFFTNQQLGAQSVCSFYESLEASLEASVLTRPDLSLDDCSDGLKSQVEFSMRAIKLIIRSRCEMAESGGSPRCDVYEVRKCARTLYHNIMELGKTNTDADVCNARQNAEDCVARFSYKCDKSRRGVISSVWSSVNRAAQRSCDLLKPPSICDVDTDLDSILCDVNQATKCSLKQLQNTLNPFSRKAEKCRSLGRNAECVNVYTNSCNSTNLPAFFIKPTKLQYVKDKLHCDNYEDDQEFGCREGCHIDSAMNCVKDFKKSMTINMWGVFTSETCRLLNDMRFCVSQNTKSCEKKESQGIERSMDALLKRFPDHHTACINVASCSANFDALVRKIKDLPPRSDFGYDGEMYVNQNGINDISQGIGGIKIPSLEALCTRARHLWTTCMQPGLKLLPQEKLSPASAMYNSIWSAVTEHCSNTVQLTCYTCKNQTKAAACQDVSETCPYNENVCLFEQINDGSELLYSAMCANPRSCYNDENSNTQVDCCTEDFCNTPGGISQSPLTLESTSCNFEKMLMCALDFTMMYISTNEMDCKKATERLSCVQRYGQTCSSDSSSELVKATNDIFQELASSSCVIDASPGDCFSLSIFSMQSILSNAYNSEGNAPCEGLRETEASVAQTIANGNCTEAGRISLEYSLAFLQKIVGPYCNPNSCEVVSWADVLNGDKTCAGHIFQGIKYIYHAYAELDKGTPTCSLLLLYVEEAQTQLSNCQLVGFLESKLDELKTRVEGTCGQSISASLPAVCEGTCQTDAVIKYVRQVRDAFDANPDGNATCMTLMQMEKVYDIYTKACTSVQQRDIVNIIQAKLNPEIQFCKGKDSSFDLEFELKRDVYFEVAECQMVFQDEVGAAFVEDDQERMCKAVDALEQCEYNLPEVFEDLIMGPTKDLISLIESTGLCPTGQGNLSEKRKKRAACDIQRLGALVKHLLIPSSIATANIESRDLYCQETDAFFKEAEKIRAACGSSLGAFQMRVYNIMKETVEKNNQELCPPLHFEQEGCNLNQADKCFNDFSAILEFADAPTDSICRLAKFSLECVARFTDNCSNAEATKASKIQNAADEIVKNIVMNKCPALVHYLFCNGDLSTSSEGCQLEKAKQCAADSMPQLSQSFSNGYCESKQANVDCTKRNLIGCEEDDIKSVSLPSAQLNSICGIRNTSLDSVCRSEPVCPYEKLEPCFSDSMLNNCSNLSQSIPCVGAIVGVHKICLRTIGGWITLQKYTLEARKYFKKCGKTLGDVKLSISAKLCASSTSLISLISDTLLQAISTADQLLRRTIDTMAQCLENADDGSNIDVRIQQNFLRILNNTLDNDNIPSTFPSAPTLQDFGTCSYSEATACLFQKMNYLLYIKLANIVERKKFCKSFTDNTIRNCFSEALDSCPTDKKLFYTRFNARLDNIISDLKVCHEPQTCILSEGFACVNKLGTQIREYDRTHDKIALCIARDKTRSCIDSFTFTCMNGETNQVMNAYNELATKINLDSVCSGVELPEPPICPEIPQSNRVCHMGSAFTCLFKFSINILQGDTLIWRQQCMTIQKMMTCVANSTSGCNETNSDVKTIRSLLKDFVTKASDHCPWLTENLCTEQARCPVTTAGCEEDLEQGLINRQADVCTLADTASECVKNNTLTCTKAQRYQAMNIMQRKLQAAGLSGELECNDGKIDGHLYSFLTASADVSVSSRKARACSGLSNLYNTLNTQFSNPDSREFLTLAKNLIDQLYIERKQECPENITSPCALDFPSTSLGGLITDLVLKNDLSNTSFCAQARALLLKNKANTRCSSQLYNILEPAYTMICVDPSVSCDVAETAIVNCIANFGNLSRASCSDQQRAAGCVTTYLPAECPYKSTWLDASNLCSDVVVLRAMHAGRSRQYICESGLVAQFSWSTVAGTDNFTITINPVAADADTAPRCLRGPSQNDPIPQVYYIGQRTQQSNSSEVHFEVYGREDYKRDGPQMVQVGFTLNSGSITYELPVTKVYVNDRNIPNSVCSSINDPHLATHDNIKYNNMDEGYFILWRHAVLAEAVVVHYSQCAKYGSCNCGVKVYAGKSSVTFDLCDSNTDLLAYSAEAGADALNQQRMAVMMETDLKTYSVVLLESGTIVKVRIEAEYMNVWITPTGRDIGATQGLCGMYDGDGYNDFMLPDGSLYDLQESDGEAGERTPDAFNAAWKITSAQADDYTQVFVPNVTIPTNALLTNCHTWSEGSHNTSYTTKCGKWANLAICGLVNGNDLTGSLLANSKQSNVGPLEKRRKRQVNQVTEVSTKNETASWPTPSGWTRESAREWCLDNIPDSALQKCTEAISSLDGTMQSFQLYQQIDECIVDIKVSDGTRWIEATRVSAYEQCVAELNQNPSYQTNLDSSTLAILFLDATCSPPDCSGHGTCSKGTCNCNPGYHGTRCDIASADLTPPKLKAPDGGIHLCQIDSNSDCSSVFISGSNFTYTSSLSCHFQEVQITETGMKEVPGAENKIVRAELIARDRVRCILSERSTWKRSLRVSVSNDGKTPDAQYQLFVAYDPVCFTCGATTCTRQSNVCVIGETCVKPGMSSIYDDCEYCNLQNPTDWTIRTDLDRCKDRVKKDSESSDNGLLIPLIGAGCALLALLIILIIGLMVFLKKRDRKNRKEMDKRYGHRNQGFYDEQPPPYIESALRVNVRREDLAGRNLSLDRYQADA